MTSTLLIRNYSLDKSKLWIIFLIAGFFFFQPLSKTDAGHFAIILWLTGLVFFLKENNRDFLKYEIAGFIAGFAFFITCLLSIFFSEYTANLPKDIKSIYPFLVFPFFYLAIKKGKLNEKDLLILFSIASLSYLKVIIDHDSQRLDGKENAVTFGNSTFLFFIITLYLSTLNKAIFLKIIGLLASLIFLYASILSETRGSYLSIPILLLFIFITGGKKNKFYTLTLFVFLALVLSQTNVHKRFEQAITTSNQLLSSKIEDLPYSASSERLKIWKSAWCHFEKSPLLGVGWKNFEDAMKNQFHNCKTHSEVKDYIQAHSVYVNTLATTGLVGSFVLAFFFIFIIMSVKEKGRHQFTFTCIAILTMLAYGFTVDLFFQKFLTERHLMIIAIAANFIYKNQQSKT